MDTTKSNTLIADFMGMKYGEKREFKDGEWTHTVRSLDKFHTSWDWLMSVVDKINHTGKAGGILYGLFDALGNADLERAHKEVVGFIQWYNEQK